MSILNRSGYHTNAGNIDFIVPGLIKYAKTKNKNNRTKSRMLMNKSTIKIHSKFNQTSSHLSKCEIESMRQSKHIRVFLTSEI